ncbi:MAG: hypothetical protein JW797_06365 [Bradymonadales bacterium]|nr:hypothetical protein [Bradymonadales bacterium]
MIDASTKLRRFLEGLKHLKERVDPGAMAGLPQTDDLDGLVGARGAPRLLLGTYSEQGVRDGLERFGVTQKLRAMDLADFEMQFETDQPDYHTLRLLCRKVEPRCILAEATLHVGRFETEAPFATALHHREIRMLYLLWLLMQNPAGKFDASRPVLPGQEKPGLSVAHEVDRLFRAMALRLRCHGIINRPEFLHAAIIYSRSYRFFDPAVEGRLMALKRDLAHLSLADASWAMYSGQVRLASVDPPRPFFWEPEEQILAIEQPLVDYFESPQYLQASLQAADRLRFQVDERFDPLEHHHPDGSPRQSRP